MSLDYEKRLEAEVDRELKSLPGLVAPHTLLLRVTAALKKSPSVPWYQQSWQTWPVGLQVVSFLLLIGLFGTLCFGAWKLSHVEAISAALQRPSDWLSTLGALGHAFKVILTSLGMAIQHLETAILISSVAALALGYAMCVGLGTVFFRVALARR